jgi:membrane protease YdiL (CAAX protease family)
MKNYSEKYPVFVATVLIILISLIRILDVFIIRSDEMFGEQVLTKCVGLFLIIIYVWSVKGNLIGIGLHTSRWIESIILGLFVMSIGLVIGYAGEWLYLFSKAQDPKIYFQPEGMSLIPGNAATGGVILGLTLFSGNIINSLMEEGFFRGLVITHFGTKMSTQKANWAQAIIFGIWHIVWPLRDYLDGKTNLGSMVGISAGYILLSGMIGFAWGYFFLKTNSLWTSISAHTLNNTMINFIHISVSTGIASTLGLRVSISTLTVIILLPFVKKIASEWKMPSFMVWSIIRND